jgi:hypothetical protein
MQFTRRGALAGGSALLASACASAGGASGEVGARLYYLGGAKVYRLDPVTGDKATLVDQSPKDGSRGTGLNDGIAIDHRRGQIYWTNMGRAAEDDGFIQRCDIDGANVTTIVAAGGAFTPKQMRLDLQHGKLWWSDREGMSIRRCNLDGSNVEVMVATGDARADKGDQARWCVGLALDVARGDVYWSQKGGDDAGEGTIRRAKMERRAGEAADRRSDIETLFAGLPEPIDLDLDLPNRMLYWCDRGDNTISRARMDGVGRSSQDREVLVRGLKEAIGLTLDLRNGRMGYTSLGGEVGLAKLNGDGARFLATEQGMLTGISWGA